MTSQAGNRCPQCNTGFFNTPNNGSPESLLARCQYCDYQRDSVKCPNCDRGYLERFQPAPAPIRALGRVLTDPKYIRCGSCGYRPSSTECPNCGQGVLEWQIFRWRMGDGGEGQEIASWSELGEMNPIGERADLRYYLRGIQEMLDLRLR